MCVCMHTHTHTWYLCQVGEKLISLVPGVDFSHQAAPASLKKEMEVRPSFIARFLKGEYRTSGGLWKSKGKDGGY